MVNESITLPKKVEENVSHQSTMQYKFTKPWVKSECSPDPTAAIAEFVKMLQPDGSIPGNTLIKVETVCYDKIRLSSEMIESVLSTLFDGGRCIFPSCNGKLSKEVRPGRKPVIAIAVPSFRCSACATSVLATKLMQRVPSNMIIELLPRFGPTLLCEFFNIANCGVAYKPFSPTNHKPLAQAKATKQSPLVLTAFETPQVKANNSVTKFETTNPFICLSESKNDESAKTDKIITLEKENNLLKVEVESIKNELSKVIERNGSRANYGNAEHKVSEKMQETSKNAMSLEELLVNNSKLTDNEVIHRLIEICIQFKNENDSMKKKLEDLSKTVSFDSGNTINQEMNQPYLQAVLQGSSVQKNKQGLTDFEIRRLNANSFNQVAHNEYATIHFQGIRSSAGVKTIKSFMKEIGVDIRKILLLWFISRDILEVTVYSDYSEELTSLLQNAQNNQRFKEMQIKRIKFDALDQGNVRNPSCKYQAKEIFRNRLQNKIAFIEKMLPTIPYWKRLKNYVELQLRFETFDVHVRKEVHVQKEELINYGECIEKQISDFRDRNKVINECHRENGENESICCDSEKNQNIPVHIISNDKEQVPVKISSDAQTNEDEKGENLSQ